MKNQERNDEYGLVGELTPTLHQKCACNLATTMKTILLGRDLSRADSVLHTRRCCHRIFSSDTDAVKEERPGVADNPSVLGDTPGGG